MADEYPSNPDKEVSKVWKTGCSLANEQKTEPKQVLGPDYFLGNRTKTSMNQYGKSLGAGPYAAGPGGSDKESFILLNHTASKHPKRLFMGIVCVSESRWASGAVLRLRLH